MGNSDVPVGQYTQKILSYYDLDEEELTDCITYGSNVKEVTTQLRELLDRFGRDAVMVTHSRDEAYHMCSRIAVMEAGIRAHQFRPDGLENSFPVEYLGEMEEPFGWIQEFRFQGQRAGTPPLWRRMPKELWDGSAAAELGVDPNHVLLLYE